MERVDLLDRLELVNAGLSTSHLIPVLTHFWFTGKSVMAFNDQIAVSVPCAMPFKGAVPGSIMLGFLRNSMAAQVEFTETDVHNELRMKASRAHLTLATLPDSEFIFKLPAFDETNAFKITKEFRAALTLCMASVGTETQSADLLGVTLVREGDELELYATDNRTIMFAKAPLKKKVRDFGRVILSPVFCKQLLSLSDGNDEALVEFTPEHALLRFGDKRFLFGQYITAYRPQPLKENIAYHMKGTTKLMVPIVKREQLGNMLERAIIITEGPSRDAFAKMKEVSRAGISAMEITVEAGVMTMYSKSPRGELTDRIALPQASDAKLFINPRDMKTGVALFEHMLVTDRCVLMTGPSAIYIIAASGA